MVTITPVVHCFRTGKALAEPLRCILILQLLLRQRLPTLAWTGHWPQQHLELDLDATSALGRGRRRCSNQPALISRCRWFPRCQAPGRDFWTGGPFALIAVLRASD
jgi:hypothetical protein